MVKITWFDGEVPQNLETRQVYGLVFSADGRILLKVELKKGKKVFSFGGGTPETFDADRVATLRREMVEELNTTLQEEVFMVGYQEIDGDGDRPTYAQVRMTALIDEIGPVQPDPDNGETYERMLTTPERAKTLLGWGEVADKQIDAAFKLAKQHFNFKTISTVEEYV